MSIIAVDFDNVLYDYDGKWRGGELPLPPVPGAPEAMQSLAAAGHKLIVFSTRGWLRKHRERMAAWLDAHHIPYDDIARTKPNADVYIDDKALRFGTWGETLYLLGESRPPAHCEIAVFGMAQTDNAARILRHADAFGAGHVHFVECKPRIHGMTGAVQHTIWPASVEFWARNGLDAVALHTRATLPRLNSLPPTCLIVIGGETNGLATAHLERCRWQYHIPMSGSYRCLTADAACAIALHGWHSQWGTR